MWHRVVVSANGRLLTEDDVAERDVDQVAPVDADVVTLLAPDADPEMVDRLVDAALDRPAESRLAASDGRGDGETPSATEQPAESVYEVRGVIGSGAKR